MTVQQVNIFENVAVQQFLNRAVEKNIRVEDHHVRASGKLRETFEWAIENHLEGNDFLIDLKIKSLAGHRMTDKQIAGAINTFKRIYADRLVRVARNQFRTQPQIPQGRYTITDGQNKVCLMLVDAPAGWNKPKGTQMAKYLYGPNNLKDYKFFAWVFPNREVQVKKDFKGFKRQIEALLVLMKADDAGAVEMGKAWAMMTNHCWRCGLPLTDDISIENGIGPICADKLGIDRRPPVKRVLSPVARVDGDELF